MKIRLFAFATLVLSGFLFVFPLKSYADGNPPQINPLSGAAIHQGQTYTENVSFTDPDSSSWTATVDYGDGSEDYFSLNNTNFTISHTYNQNTTFTVTVTITDDQGNVSTANATVTVTPYSFNATNVSFNPLTDLLTFTSDQSFTIGQPGCPIDPSDICGGEYIGIYDSNNNGLFGGEFFRSPDIPCIGNGVCEVTLLNFDPTFLTTPQFYMNVQASTTIHYVSQLLPSTIFTAPQLPPSVGTISVNPTQPTVKSAANVSASFTSSNSPDTATWNWGDGSATQSGTVTENKGSGTVSDSHIYTSLGSYTITLTVTNASGQSSTSQDVVAVVPSGGLQGGNLSGKNYSGANLSGQNISGSNLSNATFTNVDFSGANVSGVNGSKGSFTGSDFTSANLAGSNFSSANFTGSNFTTAVITGANLSNANLTNANFTSADLKGSNLHGATITGVTWSNTTCPDDTNSNNDGNTCVGHGGGL